MKNNEQLEKMLQSLPQDRQIEKQKKAEMLNVIQTHYRKKRKMSANKGKGVFLGLASVAVVFIIGIFILSSLGKSGQENINANKTLDVSKLEINEEVPNNFYHQYKPVPLELAKQVLPYKPKFPTNIPVSRAEEPIVKIKKHDDAGKVVSFEMSYLVQDGGVNQLITFKTSNFDSQFSMDSVREENVELKGAVQATYQVGKNSFVLEWEEKNVWYILDSVDLNNLNSDESGPSNEQIEKKKHELIEIVNEMK